MSATQAQKDAATANAHAAVDALAALVVVDVKPPVDCVLSEWSPWVNLGESGPCIKGSQTQPQQRARSIVTQPANGGAACGPLTETRTIQVPCVVPGPGARLPSQGIYAHGGNPPFPVGTVDQIDVSNAGKEIPFDPRNYTDFANKILAPTAGGKKVTDWLRLPLHGIPQELYWEIPILQNGVIRQYTPSVGAHDFFVDPVSGASSLSVMIPNYPNDGPRGRCKIDPYVAMHAHPTLRADGTAIPRAPYMMQMRVDGSVPALYLDGSCYILGKVPGTKGPLDFSFFPPKRELFFTADTYNNRILRTDRTDAIAARQGEERENGALWTHLEFLKAGANVTSVRCVADGTMYFAAGGIWRQQMNPDGTAKGTPALLSDFPAFWLDYLPNGDLVAAAITSECRIVNAATGATKRIGDHPLMPHTSFITVAVDRNGTCSPVGTIFLVPQHYVGLGTTNNVIITLHPDENYTRSNNLYIPFGQGYVEIGPAAFVSEPQHYLWGVEPGFDQAILTVIGTKDAVPATYRPRRTSDPVYDDYRSDYTHDFWAVLMQGTVAGHEGTRPSFSAQMSPVGEGLLGVSADTIAAMPIAEASTFIRNGMLGNVPRPELIGYPLWMLHRGLVRHSQQWIIEGAALIAAVDAFYGSPARANMPELP